jgi:hypothetical protein
MEPCSWGSTLKPFLYLAAIDQRKLTAASLLSHTPDAISGEYQDYDPKNYSNRYLGPCGTVKLAQRAGRLRSIAGRRLERPLLPSNAGRDNFSASERADRYIKLSGGMRCESLLEEGFRISPQDDRRGAY